MQNDEKYFQFIIFYGPKFARYVANISTNGNSQSFE